jgi:hypothetical protein
MFHSDLFNEPNRISRHSYHFYFFEQLPSNIIMPSLTPFRAALRAPASRFASPLVTRQFQTSAPRLAYKDDQDRESLKPKAHEYTGSGTDDQTAQNEDAAFNPDKTSPEAEKETAGEGNNGNNPLEASPANHHVAKGGKIEGDKKDSTKKGNNKKRSGGGEGPKAG